MRLQIRVPVALRCAVALVMSLFLVQTSFAVTFTITRSGIEGGRELVQAVAQANTSTSDTNNIMFDQSVKSVTLPEEITIRSDLTINGLGAEVIGSGTLRLFRVTNGHAKFERITFTGGQSSGNGGAIEVAGANASAEFIYCTFFKNSASGSGGAVAITEGSIRQLTMFEHCTIAGNTAGSGGGGISLLSGMANAYASIIVGNVSGDILGNVQTSETITGENYSISQVFLTNPSGELELSEDDKGNRVLKLDPKSPAIDAITSYTTDPDNSEIGTTAPQLNGYDLGAYEAPPVSVNNVEVSESYHYIQIGKIEIFSVSVTPDDAILNYKEYPPDGIEWWTSDKSILSVDNSGRVTALKAGTATIRAIVHGWDAEGNKTETQSTEFEVFTGLEERRPTVITMNKIADVIIRRKEYKTVTPEVTIEANNHQYTPEAEVNYRLEAKVSSPALVEVTVSGDSLLLMAGDNPGSCDVSVTAMPIPSGSSMARDFTVTVYEQGTGRSSGGGGCNIGLYGMLMVLVLSMGVIKHAG